MSNFNIPAKQWLAEQFEFEYCAECGGDAQHHTAVPFFGNWFARCDYALTDAELLVISASAPPEAYWHPVIVEYRNTAG